MSQESNANVGNVDTVNTTGNTLTSVDARGFIEGTSIYVKEKAAYYILEFGKSNVVDHDLYETARGISGAQWIKLVGSSGGGASTSSIQASWTVGLCRVYAVDGTNGDDTRAGFADPATNSTADYQVACAAAGAVAKKTFAGLAAILPKDGAGRTAEVVILGGGLTYAGSLGTFLIGCHSYIGGIPTVRGTVTNTTAGCTAFDGSAADCIMVGAVTATGMNAAGYNPTGTPTSSVIQCLQAGGGAPAFPAEIALPLGASIRFDANTTTASLRNVRRQIHKVAGTDTLTTNQVFLAAPVASDVFYIEMPGVTTTDAEILSGSENQSINIGTTSPISQIIGINFPTSMSYSYGSATFAFCFTGTSAAFNNGRLASLTRVYSHPVRGTVTTGGCRVSSFLSIGDFQSWSTLSLYVGTVVIASRVGSLTLPGGVYAGGMTLSQIGYGSSGGATNSLIGVTGALVGVAPRVLGTGFITLSGCAINISQLAFESTPASCIVVNGSGNHIAFGESVAAANVVVTGAASSFGMDLYGCKESTFATHWSGSVGAGTPNLTGGSGTFRLGNGMTGPTWAQILANLGSFRDGAGNTFVGFFAQGTGVANLSWRIPTYFTGTVFGASGAAFHYMNTAGGNVANITSPYNFPSGVREALVLRFKPTANTLASSSTVTLYKNGVATPLKVTVPAGSTTILTAIDFNTSPALVFGDVTDVFDLRIDSAVSETGHSMTGSATLEWA